MQDNYDAKRLEAVAKSSSPQLGSRDLETREVEGFTENSKMCTVSPTPS